MVNVAVLPGTDALLDAATTAACRARPALRVVAHLHSHPFARGHTWPSHTDIHGHMRPLLSKARAEGLDTTWSFIACRNRNDDGWVLQAFALEPLSKSASINFCVVKALGEQVLGDDLGACA